MSARARVHLEDQLRSQVAQGILPAELLQYAENLLRFSKTILPPPSTLERIVSSVAASGREEILRRIPFSFENCVAAENRRRTIGFQVLLWVSEAKLWTAIACARQRGGRSR
jgi:hypothetical protein